MRRLASEAVGAGPVEAAAPKHAAGDERCLPHGRAVSSPTVSVDLRVNARVTLPAADLEWTAVRASGPGGQNVNKVASKVELRFHLATTTVLDADTKARLRRLAGRRLDAEGNLVIVAQTSRNQLRNLHDARERLADLLRAALLPTRRRRATRPSRASVRARLADKHHRSTAKAARRPVDRNDS